MSADPAPRHEVQSAQDAFRELLTAHVGPALKAHGFKRQGQTFGLRGDGVWGVINFQKSQWTGRESVDFTINVGVWSDRLSETVSGERSRPKGIPAVATCQWQKRVGALMPAGHDRWWTLAPPLESWNLTLSSGLLSEVMAALIEYALPTVQRINSDRALYLERTYSPDSLMTDYEIVALTRWFGSDADFGECVKRAMEARRGSADELAFRRYLTALGCGRSAD